MKTSHPQKKSASFQLVSVMLPLLAMPLTVQAEDYTYVTNNRTITITKYTGNGGIVTIPSMINGLPVSRIGADAFYGCSTLKELTIPNTVTNVGFWAFSSCSSLAKLSLGRNVTTIEANSFGYCTSLTSVIIPRSVNRIEFQAFYGCTSLQGVYFEGNAPGIHPAIFDGDYVTTVYYLPGTTGWGPTFEGRPTALWVLPYPVILTSPPFFGVTNDAFGFLISWATNTSVVVEASSTMSQPAWSPLSTNVLRGGTSYFTDTQRTNYPSRFYRVRSS